jgi:hypothetical protein
VEGGVLLHIAPFSLGCVESKGFVIPFRIYPLVGKCGAASAAAGLIHTTICHKGEALRGVTLHCSLIDAPDTEQQIQRYETVQLSWV